MESNLVAVLEGLARRLTIVHECSDDCPQKQGVRDPGQIFHNWVLRR